MIILTKENILSYIKEHVPSLQLKEPVKVSMIGEGDLGEDVEGDGYCNYVFRVSDADGHSYIVKQSTEHLKRRGRALTPTRNRFEYEIMELRAKIVPQYVPALYQSLGVYLPLITTNCCVLGVTILAVQDYSAVVAEFGFGLAYAEALVCAAGAGVGFLVAMLLFCGVRSRVEAANPPESFKGLPITLVSAAITSLSFMGFGGLVENIINAIF